MEFETEAEYLAWREWELPQPPYRDEDEFFVDEEPVDEDELRAALDALH